MYYAEVMWWNEFEEEDVISYMFIAANRYEEATQYICQAVEHIESIKLEEFDCEERHIVYIPKEVVQQVKSENCY